MNTQETEKKAIETPYSKAWKEFKRTKEYKRGMEEMLKRGMIQPYISNILQTAFAAGYNSNKQ